MEQHEKGYGRLCGKMFELSPSEGRTSKAWWIDSKHRKSNVEMEIINMDFIVGLPCTQHKFDSIWVIVDRLRKSVHFLPVRTTYSSEDYERLYIKEIVRLHSVPISIISD